MAKKIAIVEDDAAISQMYELKLKHAGYQVKVASNGVEGLQLVESFHPDVILLDLMMPEMNGDEMLAEVRKMDWGKQIKVIALTNISETEAPDNLKDLNVDHYAVKAHHTPTQVLEIVNSISRAD